MKRYHVISISVLLGLIAGLTVSKAAEANTLTCNYVVSSVNGKPGQHIPFIVNTSHHTATLVVQDTAIQFDNMHRVINKGWKATDNENIYYRGLNDLGDIEPGRVSELSIVQTKANGITVQYTDHGAKVDLVLIGTNCYNAKA
ncbi:hypothetical protein LFD09_004336 [Salmonella enterica]|nr:hypothetical protein [Salmonella enterica]